MTDDEDLPEATSYERYWWDCPECGGANDAGDIQPSNERMTCDDCGEVILVS